MTLADLFDWQNWAHTFMGNVHFIAALVALILGPVVLFRRKGDRAHRWLGRCWALVMLGVDVSALSMYEMNGRPNLFHLFALVSLSALIPGVRAIWRYQRSGLRDDLITHQICMCWAYMGLVFAGVWQLATRVVIITDALPIGLSFGLLGVLTFVASLAFDRYLKQRYAAPLPS